MEEIKVNDYVRLDRNQGINKIIDIEDDFYILDVEIVDELGEPENAFRKKALEQDILKHSPNIIDLIEVKDLIEVRIGDEVVSKFLIQDEHILESTRIYVREGSMKIIAVVTHQQLNSIKYEVII